MGKRANINRKLRKTSNEPQKVSPAKQTGDGYTTPPFSAVIAQLVALGFVAVTGCGGVSGTTIETYSFPDEEPETCPVVKCKTCETTVELKKNMDRNEVIRKHDLKNPNCHEPGKLKLKESETESPVHEKPRKSSTTSDIETNVICDTQGNETESEKKNEATAKETSSQEIPKITFDPSKAVHPRFVDFASRRQSLQYWRNENRYCLDKAAEAGLIVLGAGCNELHCFYCNASIPTLLAKDDAWIEHALRNPECEFIRHRRGGVFLDLIVDTYFDGNPKARMGGNAPGNAPSSRSGETSEEKRIPPSFPGGLKGGSQQALQRPGLPQASRCNTLPGGTNVQSSAQHQAPSNRISSGISKLSPTPAATPGTQIASRAQPRVPKRQVQAREVRARLDMEEAQRIIQMGYTSELVGAVIAEQLIYVGDDFKSFTEMAMAVMAAHDMGDAFPTEHYAMGLKPKETQAKSLPNIPQTEQVIPERKCQSMPATRLKSLQDENEKLKEAKTCTVCFDLDRDVLFVPCGHLVVCHACSPKLKTCPLCRKNVAATVKVFHG